MLVHSLYRRDVLEIFVNITGHVNYPNINLVSISEFSLENVKIKIKLVVKENLLKYADYEEKSQAKKIKNMFEKTTWPWSIESWSYASYS